MGARTVKYDRDQRKVDEISSVTTNLRTFIKSDYVEMVHEDGSPHIVAFRRESVLLSYFDTLTSASINFYRSAYLQRRAQRCRLLELETEPIESIEEKSRMYNERGLEQVEHSKGLLNNLRERFESVDYDEFFDKEISIFEQQYQQYLADIDIKPEDAGELNELLGTLLEFHSEDTDSVIEFLEYQLNDIEKRRNQNRGFTDNLDPVTAAIAISMTGIVLLGAIDTYRRWSSSETQSRNAEQLSEAAAETTGTLVESQN